MAPKTTHYLFTFLDGAFLSRAQALGKTGASYSRNSTAQRIWAQSHREAHVTVLPTVSGSASVFPFLAILMVSEWLSLPLWPYDKRSRSPSFALKWTLTAPDRERLTYPAVWGVFWFRASSEAQQSPFGPSCILFVPMLKSYICTMV